MKKGRVLILLLVVIMSLSFMLTACDNNSDGNDAVVQQTNYIIQYTDDTGTYTINVKSGEPYSMSAIPSREGYDFVGLFDAETGGTQYVNSKGASLAPFTDNKNLVLFPRFSAKEYILALDYQGAAVTGEREIAVSYGSRISNLPTNLVLDNKEFMGWYTEPNRGGLQVADQYGVIPTNSVISSDNFDLTDPNGFIRLYAGFRGELRTVTFYVNNDATPEEIQIEHGTPISDVVLETRVDGKAVLLWSTNPNDTEKTEIFNGKVTSDMVLYAAEFAPVIDFDSEGGKDVKSIVARAGSAIALPTAQRDNYQFAGWYTTGGVKYMATTMPTDSVKLKAKWTPMLIFDERGGTLVDDIAAEQGTKVTLPTTEKDGYMFAGWYTEQGEVYTATAMPEFSTKLVAKYHKILNKTIVLINETNYIHEHAITDRPSMDEEMHQIDLNDLYGVGVREIKVTVHYQSIASGASTSNPKYTYMAWYSAKNTSDAYKVWSYSDKHTVSATWNSFTQENTINLVGGFLYVCRYSSMDSVYVSFGWKDFWIEVEYPDMTQLY